MSVASLACPPTPSDTPHLLPATHDSIGIGEDGPTHQPVALAAFYRALPNFNLIRPADAEECMGAWILALSEEEANTPSIFALSRQPVPLLEGSSREKVKLGAYAVVGGEIANPDLVLIATGAEVARAIETAKLLHDMTVRVVSMPSQSHFDAQSREYRKSVIPPSSIIIAIEAWSSYGWAKYAHASLSVQTFGHSAPQEELFNYFGFSPKHLAEKVASYVEDRRSGAGYEVGDFRELLLGHVGVGH